MIDLRVQAVFATLFAPVFEEYLFRKVIIERTKQYGERFTVIYSALVFGLFHGNIQELQNTRYSAVQVKVTYINGEPVFEMKWEEIPGLFLEWPS